MQAPQGGGRTAAMKTPSTLSGQAQPQASREGTGAGQFCGANEQSAGLAASHAQVEHDSAVDTHQLLEQLRSFHDLVSAAAGQLPKLSQAAGSSGQAAPHTPPPSLSATVPDTPVYGMGTAPDSTPQPVGCAASDATGFGTPVCSRQTAHYSTPLSVPLTMASAGPWEATPEARTVLHGQRELMAQLQRLLVNPGALQAPGASLKELQGSLLQATASLQHSRALHNIQGVLGDSYRFDTPPAAQRQTRSDGQSSFGHFPAPGLLEETPNQAAVMGDYGVQQQDEQSLEDFQQVVSSSRRMQSLLSNRLSSSKKFKEARSDWSDIKPPAAACSTAMHADGPSITSYLPASGLHSSSDDGGSAAGKQTSSGSAGTAQPGQRLQDRRSSWHQMTEPRAEALLTQPRQRRATSAADEALAGAARVQDIQEDDDEPLAGITREVNGLLRSPGKPASRRWSLEHPTQAKTQKTPVDANGVGRRVSNGGSGSAGKSTAALPPRQANIRATPLSTGNRGSPDMEVHCNPLFGAEGLPIAAAAHEGDAESSKGRGRAESAPDAADGRLMKQDSTKLHSGAADAAEALHPLPAMPKVNL